MAVTKLSTEKPRGYRGMLQALRRLIHAEVAKKQVTVGGMRVRVGNDLFDGSVKARLERLQESL